MRVIGNKRSAAGPDAGDMHVDKMLLGDKSKVKKSKKLPPNQMPPNLQNYLTKLKELLKGSVPGPVFDAAVKSARGHAGGKAKAQNRTAQEGDTPTGVMIGYWLKSDEASTLAMSNGEAPTDLHLTLAYLGDMADLPGDVADRAKAALSALAYAVAPVVIESTGIDRFGNADSASDGMDVVYATVDDCSPDEATSGCLGALRERICMALCAVGLMPRNDHGEYVPHITLAYVDPDAEITVTLPDVEMTIDTITLAVGGTRTDFALTGTMDADTGYMGMSEPLRLSEFMEPPATIPVLPKPGSYEHPSYGTIDMSAERIANFVSNFKAEIYQARIPVDLEHQTKVSGAAGWITGLKTNEDGSVDATVEWTDMGNEALKNDRFNFVSPEWYDEWQSPIDRKDYSDVLIGAALTTRPFFKAPALRPLAATEIPSVGYKVYSDSVDTAKWRKVVDIVTVDPKVMSEDQVRAFTEMQAEIAELKAAKTAAEATAKINEDAVKQASEKIALMETSARHKRFTDEVMGRGDSNGVRWFGEPAINVGTMEQLANTAGEDSEVFKAFIGQMRATGKAMADSKLFSEMGTGAEASTGDPQGQMNTLARKRAAEKSISIGQATREIMNEQPDLARQAGEQARVRV